MMYWIHQWKSPLLWSSLLVTVLAAVWIWPRPSWLVMAGVERPTCDDWDEWWFHHRVTLGQLQACLHGGAVDINQTDEEYGRTLLHRIAVDFKYNEEFSGYTYPLENPVSGDIVYSDAPTPGNTREQRLAFVQELLQWDDLDLEKLDDRGRTAFHYAVRNGHGFPMARLLLEAGARATMSENAREQWEERTIPLVQTLSKRFKNPLDGSVDFDRLLVCRTVECLEDELVLGRR